MAYGIAFVSVPPERNVNFPILSMPPIGSRGYCSPRMNGKCYTQNKSHTLEFTTKKNDKSSID